MLAQILLQATPQGFDYSSIIMIVVLIAVFYFFMIRPQTKKQKEIKKFREGLSIGDTVITAGGIYGKIRTISSDSTYVMLEIADGVKIKIDINMIYPKGADANASVQG